MTERISPNRCKSKSRSPTSSPPRSPLPVARARRRSALRMLINLTVLTVGWGAAHAAEWDMDLDRLPDFPPTAIQTIENALRATARPGIYRSGDRIIETAGNRDDGYVIQSLNPASRHGNGKRSDLVVFGRDKYGRTRLDHAVMATVSDNPREPHRELRWTGPTMARSSLADAGHPPLAELAAHLERISPAGYTLVSTYPVDVHAKVRVEVGGWLGRDGRSFEHGYTHVQDGVHTTHYAYRRGLFASGTVATGLAAHAPGTGSLAGRYIVHPIRAARLRAWWHRASIAARNVGYRLRTRRERSVQAEAWASGARVP